MNWSIAGGDSVSACILCGHLFTGGGLVDVWTTSVRATASMFDTLDGGGSALARHLVLRRAARRLAAMEATSSIGYTPSGRAGHSMASDPPWLRLHREQSWRGVEMAPLPRDLTAEEFLQAIDLGGTAFQAAVSALYSTHSAPLIRWAVRRVGNRAVADDLVQQAFMQLIDRRHQYNGGAVPAGYLFGILRNLTNDWIRNKLREPLAQQGGPEAEEEGPDPIESLLSSQKLDQPEQATLRRQLLDNPEQALLRRQVQECIKQRATLIDELPSRYQMVIGLILEDGLKPAEIAEVIGSSSGATRQLIYECMKRLRAIFRPCYELLPDDRASGQRREPSA